jgi:hypothetical protein
MDLITRGQIWIRLWFIRLRIDLVVSMQWIRLKIISIRWLYCSLECHGHIITILVIENRAHYPNSCVVN